MATYLMQDRIDKIVYIHIDNQHSDTLRFVKDCEKLLGKDIEILQSQYKSVENVIKQFRFINSAWGARCTEVLKKRVRKEWEYGKENIEYVWGFDADEKQRADRLITGMPDFKHHFPLIDRNLRKDDIHGMSLKLGLRRPIMYDLGYENNNCVGCVKGGMGYWNKIRVDFPEVFERMAELEREVGRSCIKNVFLDELDPKRGWDVKEVMEECSIACQINLRG